MCFSHFRENQTSVPVKVLCFSGLFSTRVFVIFIYLFFVHSIFKIPRIGNCCVQWAQYVLLRTRPCCVQVAARRTVQGRGLHHKIEGGTRLVSNGLKARFAQGLLTAHARRKLVSSIRTLKKKVLPSGHY